MLLEDIIALATDSQQSISVLLRKCLVLAHQLKNERLKMWVNGELNGYPSHKDLPEYRVLSAGAFGTFVGPGWAQTQQIIPSAALKPEHKMWAEDIYLQQSIKSLEHVVEAGSETLTFPWDHNLIALYQDELLSGWHLTSAHQRLPKAVIVGILDTVRNRILSMALELKAEVGETDDDLKQITPQGEKMADKTITNNIYGNVYLATQQSTITVQQQSITVGNWAQLEQVLQHSGLSKPEIGELSEAVEQDKQTMGSKVRDWIKKTSPKVKSGGVKIAVAVGQTLLTEYLKQYFGMS